MTRMIPLKRCYLKISFKSLYPFRRKHDLQGDLFLLDKIRRD